MTKARNLADNALTTVSPTELGYLDGVTSAVQTQLDAKLATTTASTTYLANALVDAKGDILTATADNTPARLAVGTDGQVLTAASGQTTGLQWTTPAAGSMTVIASGNFPTNVTRVDITGIPNTYIDLYLVMENPFTTQNAQQFYIRPNNNDTSASYYLQTQNSGSTTLANSTSNAFDLGGFGILNDQNNQRLSLIFKAYNYKSTNSQKFCEFWATNTSQMYFQRGIPNALSTTAISSLSLIIANNLQFRGGSYVLYGVK
jgi:hypothetical protein